MSENFSANLDVFSAADGDNLEADLADLLAEEEMDNFAEPAGSDDDEEDLGGLFATPFSQTVVNVPELGQSNENWKAFLDNLQSRKLYEKRLGDFLSFYCRPNNTSDMAQSVSDYINTSFNTLNNGKRVYSSKTLRSWFSVLVQFFHFSGKGDLKKASPIVEVNLAKWDKVHVTTKAGVFLKSDIARLYAMPDNAELLLVKAYTVVALSFAARGCEVLLIQYSDVTYVESEKGEGMYRITYTRSKNTTSATTDGEHSFVQGAAEVAILSKYRAAFPISNRSGRFFRKVNFAPSTGSFTVGKAPVGKNTTSAYGKRVATLLGLSNPDKFTGHTWRRTSITWSAESGRTIPQLKTLSGHHSDSVLQGYIDNSDLMRMDNTAGTSVDPSSVGTKRSSSGAGLQQQRLGESAGRGSTLAVVAPCPASASAAIPVTININMVGATVYGSVDLSGVAR